MLPQCIFSSESISANISHTYTHLYNALLPRWEKVRSLAMEKQTELHRLVMQLQRDKMAGLR